MRNRFEHTILNKLLDKYENSKSFTGDNVVSQKFSVKIAALYPQYTNHANFEVFQSVNEAIDILIRKKFIFAKINSANVCTEAWMNLDEIDKIYVYVSRLKKKDIHHAIMKLLDQYMERNELLNRFCTAQKIRIRMNKSVQLFNGDIVEFTNILIAVDELLRVESETFARDFSVRVFKDSKAFDRISSSVSSLVFEYGDFPERDLVLASLNIVKNPTYVNFKGAGILQLAGQRLDLSVLRSDIAISSVMLPDIEQITITGKSVMTIENLTSFHSMPSSDHFIIYLGGFHNSVRRAFIRKIFEQNPGVEFYHYGDIDAGGFYILEHLISQTGIDIQPYRMDKETLKKYESYSKKLTDNDRERLKKLGGGRFFEVIEYMLANDCKLEQEASSADGFEREDDL